jgi:hypothetical protein
MKKGNNQFQVYFIPAVYLALVVAGLVLAVYMEWYDLLPLIAVFLIIYGAFKLLTQTETGTKMVELLPVTPLLMFAVAIAASCTIYPLGAMLHWWPWVYHDGKPIYGGEIFEHPGTAAIIFGIVAFWAAVTLFLIYVWKKRRD